MSKQQAPSQTEKKHKSVTLNPYMIRKLGIIRNQCWLQTDDYKLSCVPYQLSLEDCKVLLILSPREQKIITESTGRIMLHVEFHLPDYSKPVPMFIRLAMRNFQQLNASRNQCLLTADLQNIPRDYRELMEDFFHQQEQFRSMHHSPFYNSKSFTCPQATEVGIHKTVLIRTDEGEKISGRIIDLSLSKLSLYMDIEKEMLENLGESFLVEMKNNQTPFMINGSLKDFCASREVEGYYIVQIGLQFSCCLADSLLSLFPEETGEESEPDGEEENTGNLVRGEDSPEEKPQES